MDGELRKDPQKNKIWLKVLRKAKLGWSNLNLHREYVKLNNEPETYFLGRAEEYLMQAKQTFFKAMRRDASRSLKIHR